MENGIGQGVEREWQAFIRGRKIMGSRVRPLVLESWERSRRAGVDPEGVNIRAIPAREFQKKLEKHRRLLRIAGPVIEHLFEYIRGSRSILILSDAGGVILSRLGDPDHLTNSTHYEPGIDYSESSVGTNGIGTCTTLRAPVQIWGAEHFARRNHSLCCSAAPIHDPEGELLGCLNLSCLLEQVHSHTLGMVAAAAGSIERQFKIEGALDRKDGLLREKQKILELITDGLLSVDSRGRITDINSRARQMLGIGPAEGVGRKLGDYILSGLDCAAMLSRNRPFSDRDATLKLRDTVLPCTLSASPVSERGGVIITLREARRVRRMVNRYSGARAVFTYDNIVGDSPQIREAVRLARVAGGSEANTLILGESGTGKEIFAQAIHNGSERRSGPFIAINCGALPRDLIQSELFGYVSGAFTGASRQGNPGKFELADGGTIFLDEIGEMPTSAQVNLLRVVETKEVTRVGDQFARPVDVRIIAATNRSLQHAIREGTFREDLYYRLNILTINLPPLRLRTGDLEVLTAHFLRKICLAADRPVVRIDPDVVRSFERYPWPGNIRELENVIERAVYICRDDVIRLDDIQREIRQAIGARHRRSHGQSTPVPVSMRLEDQEKQVILHTLDLCHGNIKRSAARLGMARSTLYTKLKKYGIDPAGYRHPDPDMS